MKKFIKIFSILLVALTITGCGSKKKNEDKKETPVKIEMKDKEVVKEQTVKGLKISNVNMQVIDGMTNFSAKVTNTTKEDMKVETVKIIVKDENKKEMAKLTGYVGSILKPNETKDIINTTDIDLSKAKSISYEIEQE
ncbi:MAG: hypothetical protein E7158_03420 [Firmicutes bacterium]|nr:hypothetical protein [Bacillota bacterium]